MLVFACVLVDIFIILVYTCIIKPCAGRAKEGIALGCQHTPPERDQRRFPFILEEAEDGEGKT
jgi:hypothetical protein